MYGKDRVGAFIQNAEVMSFVFLSHSVFVNLLILANLK